MAITDMAFSPATGLLDTTTYPTEPADETAARTQIQGRLNEIRDWLNNTLIAELTKMSFIYAEDSGSTDAYAITLNPAPAAYTTGMVVIFKANTANTGACTVDANGKGAKGLKKKGASGTLADLATGDIAAGNIVAAVYDGTYFVTDLGLGSHLAETITYVALATKTISSNSDVNGVDQTIAISLPIAPKKVRVQAFISGTQYMSDGTWDGSRKYAMHMNGSGTNIGKFAVTADYIGEITDSVSNGFSIQLQSVSITSVVLRYAVDGTAPTGTLYLIITADTH